MAKAATGSTAEIADWNLSRKRIRNYGRYRDRGSRRTESRRNGGTRLIIRYDFFEKTEVTKENSRKQLTCRLKLRKENVHHTKKKNK